MKWYGIGAVLLVLGGLCVWYGTQSTESNMNQRITIGFMGDVMLGRLVNEKISRAGYTYPWGNVLPLLKENTLNIINLETTLTISTQAVPKVFNFKASPDKVKTLTEGNITVTNIANNHILDFSYQGMIETIATLDKAHIRHVGAGINEDEARKPVILTFNDTTLGILGYTDNEPGWASSGLKPGTHYVKVGDIRKIQEDIEKIRSKVDIVILSIHWGPNMRDKPTQEFIDFAHAIIDAGVDIFHGHSAHVVQGIEKYKNKLIMYDTGDFVDDYAVDELLRNDRSFLFRVTVDKTKIKHVQLIPVIISSMQVNLAQGDNYTQAVEKIQQLSAPFGTTITNDGIIHF
jgi:poly-gamma-glutamate capsule biosynthesis protein CapA/YwtB (metallophosphatase superfamily)